MNFNHKKMIGLSFLALAVLALFLVVAYTAEAQQNWPKGENSGNPSDASAAEVVDGSDGDAGYDTPPEGAQVLMNMWYNATGGDWIIENGDSVYRANQTIDMKYFDILIESGGQLKLENVTIFNTNITIDAGGTLVLYEDGSMGDYSRSVNIDAGFVDVYGTLSVEALETKHASFGGLVDGLALYSPANIQDLTVSPANDGIGVFIFENKNVVLENCVFNSGENAVAMVIYGDAPATIQNNVFDGKGVDGAMGLLLAEVDEIDIKDNSFIKFKHQAIAGINSTATITGNDFTKVGEYGTSGSGGAKGDHDYYVIYMVSDEATNSNTIREDNDWATNGEYKMYMQSYNLTVTVNDADEPENGLEGIKVTLDGVHAVTYRENYTNEDGEAYLDCVEYYIYGNNLSAPLKHGTNNGNDPYNLSATDGVNLVYEDFEDVGHDVNDPGVTLLLKQKSYDFEPINFEVTTDFTGDAIFVGEELTFSCDVKNNGNKDATAVAIGFYLVDGTRADPPQTFLGEDIIDINAASQAVAEYTYTPDGTYANQAIDFKVVTNYNSTFYKDYDDTNDEAMKMDQHLNTKPVVSFTSPTEGADVTAFNDITGTVTDGDGGGVAGVEVMIGADNWEDATVNGGTWTYSGWSTEFNGDLVIKAKALDTKTRKSTDDNVNGDEEEVNVTVKIPATIEFKLGTPPMIYGSGNVSYLLEGTATPPGSNTISKVAMKVGDGAEADATYNAGDNSWSYEWAGLNDLADGNYLITVTATDDHDVITTHSKTILLYADNTATNPALNLITTSGETMTGDTMDVDGYVIEDYHLKSVEYSIDGTNWLAITSITQVGNNYSWSVSLAKSSFSIQEDVENYNVWFRASDDEVTSDVRILVVKIPSGPTGIDLFLVAAEVTVDTTTLKQNQLITVTYTIHKDGAGTADNVRIEFYIGDKLAATEDDVAVSTSTMPKTKDFKPGQSHVDKKDITVTIVFTNDEDTTNNDVTIETKAVIAQDTTVKEEDDGGFLSGFGLVVVAVAALVAMALIARRKH